MPSLLDALNTARERLTAAGIRASDASIDIEVFARAILGWDRARLLTERTAPAPPALEPRFSEWVERRTRHEPVAYILGSREFWGLDLIVTPAVLIPRPETEFVVEEALPRLRGLESPRAADIGTGSGNIAVALASELPACRLVATDISREALVVAHENALRHHVADRIEFAQTSHLDGIAGPFDLIAANPPYVKETDRPGIARDVRHEPEVALFGGRHGLLHIGEVLDAAAAKLRPGGWLIMEFGFGQEEEVEAMVNERPALRFDHVHNDLQDIPRTAVIERRDRS